MKKGVLLALLTYVAVVHSVNFLILLSHLSVTSKGIALMLSSFVFSSVGLLVILVSLDTWSTTRLRAGSNRLASLRLAEERIARRLAGTTTTKFDLDTWEELNEQDRRNNTVKLIAS